MRPLRLACSLLSLFVLPTLALAQEAPLRFDPELYSTLAWRNIGPERGGRSLTCSGSPGRKNEYWFGATGGGAWKTTDGGNTWQPMTDGKITSSSVGAIAVAETNPDVVYLGMGETQLRGSITQGDGIYKTVDGGDTWRHLGVSEGLADTQAISRIRVHPTDPDVVYVAALGHPYGDNEERGVFRSKDGGNTWERVLFVSPKAGAADLWIDRRNPSVVYASIWQVYRKAWKMWGGGPDSGLWKSENGGDTWHELTENPGMPEGPIGKIGITVSPVDSQRLYAIVEAPEGGVFRSDDGGATWKRTNDERKLRQRHFYYSRIVADPLDRDTVYGLNTGLYRSTDGGVTFEDQIRPPHGDQHDLWIDPNDPKRMCNSNDGGGNVSLNGGETWTEQDFPTTQLYHTTTTSDVPYHVCGAQQDNSTLCIPSDGWGHMQARGPNHGWYYDVGGGESGYITQSPTDPDVFYAGNQGAQLTRYDRSTGQIRDIQVYPRFFSGEPASALPERWQWTFPIVFSPLDPQTLYTCSQHVWKSTDDGQSWERISPDLTYADPETLGETGGPITMDMNGPEIYATVFALAPSFHDVGTIWAGSDDGRVHVTRDGGASWSDITPPGLPKFSRVSILDESRHSPGTLYVAANRYQVDDREPYVFRTRDYGSSWTKITDGIAPGHFARAVREDPEREGLLFLGTEHGVYVSFDAGDHWQSLQLSLPDTPVRDLVVRGDDVVLGTHGRGFWILDDIQPLRELTTATSSEPLRVFSTADAIRGVTNATIQYVLGEELVGEGAELEIEILDAEGDVLDTFTGKAGEKPPEDEGGGFRRGPPPPPTVERGLNRYQWNLRAEGATTFEGMILWSARAEAGPRVPPGSYRAQLTARRGSEEHTATIPFEVVMDPNLRGVTEADLREQYALASKIRDQTSRANEAVIRIRALRAAVDEATEPLADPGVRAAADELREGLGTIEEALYQVQNQSNQDPLNFPIKLNNRLSSLRRSVETGDAKPTDAAYRVFDELSAELEGHLEALEETIDAGLPALNEALEGAGADPVEEPEDDAD